MPKGFQKLKGQQRLQRVEMNFWLCQLITYLTFSVQSLRHFTVESCMCYQKPKSKIHNVIAHLLLEWFDILNYYVINYWRILEKKNKDAGTNEQMGKSEKYNSKFLTYHAGRHMLIWNNVIHYCRKEGKR